jgi:uncharacterized membrane protein
MGLIYTDGMNTCNTASDKVVFSARLTPYRSLGPNGFRILIGCICGVCLIIGLVFFALGLWPVLGFMGLDVALIYWAFKSNYGSAKAYEDIEISRRRVLLRKVSPRGLIRITRMQISHRQQSVELGRFLNPPDRESFAAAFQMALARARR